MEISEIINFLIKYSPLVTSIFAVISLLMVWYQMRINYEVKRRELALTLIKNLHDTYHQDSYRFTKFLFSLPPDDIKLVIQGKELNIRADIIAEYLPEFFLDNQKDYVKIPSDFVIQLRFAVIRILNSVEEMALAYVHGIVDKKIINDGFYAFFIEKEFLSRCISFRKIYSESAWKSLEPLQVDMNKSANEMMRKPPI